MAAQLEKVLRIGVILGGKIVEERVLPARQPITLGSAPRNTMVVKGAGVPLSLPLFTFQGERYVLHFEQGAEGRIQGPRGDAELGALVSQGLARQTGKTCSIPVNDDQRGKIVIGALTLLWQFVTPPAEVPKPALPKEAKGAHFKSMDRLFVTVLAVSFLLHTAFYFALARAAPAKEVSLEEIPDRYARVLIPERMPQPPQKQEEKKPEVQQAQKTEKQEEKKAETPEQTAHKKAVRAAAVAKAVQSKGLLKVLGALGPGAASGAVADVFGTGAGVGDVASALSGAGGVAVATDPGAGGGRKGGGEGGSASIGSLATTGGGKVGLGAKSEVNVNVKISGSVAAEEAEVDSSDVDQGKLGAFVRARMGLIKACYENALKRNPHLKGKISIRFTILETGALTDLTTSQNSLGSAEVASCIMNTMRAWRTQFRPSGPVTVEYPFVFQPVN